jgi:hypothetical protein
MTSAEALGRAVKERRTQLRLSQDLRLQGGPGPRTVWAIERGTSNLLPYTRTQLEKALCWPRGHVDRVLAGTAGPLDRDPARPLEVVALAGQMISLLAVADRTPAAERVLGALSDWMPELAK